MWDGDKGVEILNGSLSPLFLFARPFTRGGIESSPEPWRVVSENAIIGNTHCVKLRAATGKVADTFWVDPDRDDVILGRERLRRGSLVDFLSIEYRRDKQHGWVPAQWTKTDYWSGGNRTAEETVASFTLNETFLPQVFSVTFPPGTNVLDRTHLERYIVAEDGSKANVIKYDSLETIKIYEALDQTVDFTVDQEPLKDALEFIAQRYLIKINIDAQAIRQGLIDPSIDVKLGVAGIKLKSTLNLLLEQSRKPLAYRVRNGALTVIAASQK